MGHVIPAAAGEPDLARGGSVGADGLGDGRGDDVVAEKVFLVPGIGGFRLGIIVVERPAEGNAGDGGVMGGVVDVWGQRIAKVDGGLQHRVVFRESPNAAVQEGVFPILACNLPKIQSAGPKKNGAGMTDSILFRADWI